MAVAGRSKTFWFVIGLVTTTAIGAAGAWVTRVNEAVDKTIVQEQAGKDVMRRLERIENKIDALKR